MLEISIEGIQLCLHAKRGVFWPDRKTLFIADTHFGKEATFRSQGIAVPRGSTQATLNGIAEMIAEFQAANLILLGDMFHARSSFSQDTRDALDNFFGSHPHLNTSLVLGNHDRGIHALIQDWPIGIVDSGAVLDSICISHFPQAPCQPAKLLLCGHLHPAYRFQSKLDSVGKLPCFWLSNRQLVLPAIGDFTGTQVVHPSKTDQTWVIVDDRVIRV
jgi:DNA ligase-associated metallophosphoesterase